METLTPTRNAPLTRRAAVIHFVRFLALLGAALVCLCYGIMKSPFHGHGAWDLWVREPLVMLSLALSALAVWISFRFNRRGWIGGLFAVLIVNFVSELYFSAVKCGDIVADDAYCTAHKKVLMMAVLLYAEDHDYRLPFKESWETVSKPFARPGHFDMAGTGKRYPAAFNGAVSGADFDSFEDSTSVPLLFDTRLKGPNAYGGKADWFDPHFGGHQIGGHVVTLDGYVRKYRPSSTKKLNWGKP